ncbi:heterodisulfide reductase-related iron-sulfur binding cluster [Methylovirgula sp. HY1]|uniref:heterodisulfide reductase-related iron-sulfur binding cluster n=1 Tax=Methylovirgula sp. HY1 TaxID=2822761 RepID=UPI001C5B6DC4|nr:heterodisulfide reductase-related iron-sulfur binding cluster [Methylovirgula sp. HY1]QXX73250.1 Anaerobic glycerol-3-phosphate dehydrogenase subunit C [Methylovirgula sp. HY1]
MREGGLAAPTRHPLAWEDPEFYDEAKLDTELRRVFDICHTCRRCFNLCDSFPRLFDLIDESKTGELDSVASASFKPVIDACTLCDMCFMTKCPYVPPHEFNIDFPHLMLRARAVEAKKGEVEFSERELAKTDRNGKLAAYVAPLANWATNSANKMMRGLLEKAAGLHHEAHLPKYQSKSFATLTREKPPVVDRSAPGFGRKAVLFSTCFTNYNDPQVGLAARAVLAKNGVETEVVYPQCCGMPLLEQGLIGEVAKAARTISGTLQPWIEKGYDVIASVPSCALMLKFEWPLILPNDAGVKLLSKATFDLSEYVVDIARKEGIAPGLQPIEASLALHISCHSRAQNMGQKAAEMVRLIPGADVQVMERCSGHGGTWGYRTENFETALKVGRPVAQQARDGKKACVASECPLAGLHITQGIEKLDGETKLPALVTHPIELVARAYGLAP